MVPNRCGYRCPAIILLLLAGTIFPRLLAAQEAAVIAETATKYPSAPQAAELSYPGETLRDGIKNLAQHHELAILADPGSLESHVGLVDAYTMLWCFGYVPRDEVLTKVQSAAQKAVELDEHDAAARTALGIAKFSAWDWTGAEKELVAAVRLDPGRAPSHHWYALYLAASGRHQEALKESEQAVAIDQAAGMQTGLGAVLYFGRDWKRMIDQMQTTIDRDPGFAPAHDWLGMAYVQEQHYAKSIATYQRAVDLSGGLAEILAGLGHAYGLAGEADQARAVLEKLQQLDERWYVPPVQIAYVLVGLGEHEEAFRYLDRAYSERSWELVFLRVEPWFDAIRSDQRFKQLEAKMNFPE